MADYLRPCASLTAWSVGNAGYYGPGGGFLSYGNHERYRDSKTTWARFWVRWNHMRPWDGADPATDKRELVGLGGESWPNMTPQLLTWHLDNQIAAARAAGLSIILCTDDFPAWVNGGQGSLVPPTDVSVTSPYGQWIRWLCNRYSLWSAASRGDNVWVDFLEVCNEPNGRWQGSGNKPAIAAGMLRTARTITANYTANRPIVCGPATTDGSDAAAFVDSMFNNFGSWRGDENVAWTHHNYIDVERSPTTCPRAWAVREKLRTRGWLGWPYQDASNPYVLLTEGGARIGAATGNPGETITEPSQRTHVAGAWNKSRAQAGIGMFTNYQFWSSGYDSGMLQRWELANGPEPGPVPPYYRPVYNEWKVLGTGAPRTMPDRPWNLHVCFVADGKLWHTVRYPTGWDQAVEIGAGKGTFVAVDCAAVAGSTGDRLDKSALGALHVVAVTADGELWHSVRYKDGTWQSFTPIDVSTGGERGPWRTASCAAIGGDLHVCAILQDGTPWHTIRFTPPAAGSGWQTFGSITQAAGNRGTFVDIDCTCVLNELHVCAVTSDGHAWHTIRHHNYWDGFGGLKWPWSDPGPITKMSCAGITDRMHGIAVTGDGRIWHTLRHPTQWDGWSDVESLTNSERGTFSDVDCANQAGDLHVMGVSRQAGRSDTEGWHTIRHPNSWDGLGTLEGAVGERGNVTAVSASAVFPL